MQKIMVITVLIMLLAACAPAGTPVLAPAEKTPPPETLVVMNTPTRGVEPTQTPLLTSTLAPSPTLKPTRTATPEPEWVAQFAQPILNIIAVRAPDYTEDFSEASPDWQQEIKKCYVEPGRDCEISDGVYKISSKILNEWAVTQIPCFLPFVNFAMSVDINTGQLSGENSADVAYNHRGSEFDFEIKDRGRWSVRIHDPENQNAGLGQVTIPLSQKIQKFLVIVHNNQIAFYLNDLPMAHADFIPVKNDRNLTLMAWSGGGTAKAEYDNVKIWVLDKVPELQ